MAANPKRGKFNWTPVDVWCKENPTASWNDLLKDFPKFPFSNPTFYSHRKQILGNKSVPRGEYTKRALYQTITVIPRLDISDAELKGMNRFNDMLQKYTKLKFEIIELVNPPQIEIRQCQSR